MQGYYITLKGDTAYGSIDFQDVYKRTTQCRFRRTGSDTVFTLLPGEIRVYCFVDGRHYVSRTVSLQGGDRNLFIECLVEGYLSAFLYKDEKREHYYLSRSGERLLEVPYKEGRIYIESDFPNNIHEGWNYYHTVGHIPLLEKQLNDVPELRDRIKRLKYLNRHNFTKLIADYNKLRCKSDTCFLYETREPSIRLAKIEPVLGMVWFPEPHSAGVQAGAACAVSFPNSDQSLQIRTGFIYVKELKSASDNYLYIVPLQLQFPYVSDKLRIDTYVGFWAVLIGLSAGGDLQLKVREKVHFSMGSEIDLAPINMASILERKNNSFQPFSIIMVSFHVGVSFIL